MVVAGVAAPEGWGFVQAAVEAVKARTTQNPTQNLGTAVMVDWEVNDLRGPINQSAEPCKAFVFAGAQPQARLLRLLNEIWKPTSQQQMR